MRQNFRREADGLLQNVAETGLVLDVILREQLQFSRAPEIDARVADVQAANLVAFQHDGGDGGEQFRAAALRHGFLVQRAVDELGEFLQRARRAPRFWARLEIADDEFDDALRRLAAALRAAHAIGHDGHRRFAPRFHGAGVLRTSLQIGGQTVGGAGGLHWLTGKILNGAK